MDQIYFTADLHFGHPNIEDSASGSGGLRVSTQFLYVDSSVLAAYQGSTAFAGAANSYGGINVSAVYLNPRSSGSGSVVTPPSGSGGSGSQGGGSGSVTPSGGGSSETGGNTGGSQTGGGGDDDEAGGDDH